MTKMDGCFMPAMTGYGPTCAVHYRPEADIAVKNHRTEVGLVNYYV
jgi:hypothetical protein